MTKIDTNSFDGEVRSHNDILFSLNKIQSGWERKKNPAAEEEEEPTPFLALQDDKPPPFICVFIEDCSLAQGECYESEQECLSSTPCEEAPEDALWLPVRSRTILGCTYENCAFGGFDAYHPYWALDFNPPEEYESDGRNSQGEMINIYSAGTGTAYIVDRSDDGSCIVPDADDPSTYYHPSNAVAIDHGDGVVTYYLHLNEILVSNGASVTKDTVLGSMGTAGVTSPCPFYHLHFEKIENAILAPNPEKEGTYQIVSGEQVDPGPLLGCRDGLLVTYPEEAGISGWDSFIPAEQLVWIESDPPQPTFLARAKPAGRKKASSVVSAAEAANIPRSQFKPCVCHKPTRTRLP
jgi:hypothetical protein